MSKLSGLNRSQVGEVEMQKGAYSMHNEPHFSVGRDLFGRENGNDLVKFGVDMSELSDYLDNIIQVVN